MGRPLGRGRDAVTLGTVLAAMLFAGCPCAFALNPALDASQYAHNGWKIREGLFKGVIDAITQTPDGYLWLGTELGLVRFDGVKFFSWTPPGGQQLPSTNIQSLLAARDGTLWIGTAGGLSSWKSGKLTNYPEVAGQRVWTILEDHNGTVWAGGHADPVAKLCAVHGDKVQCYGADGSFGQYIESLHEDRSGNLWVGGIRGLWHWSPGPPKLHPMPDTVLAMAEGDSGALLTAMLSGIRQFVDGKLDAPPLSATGRRVPTRSILRDRNGGLWLGTIDRGVVHLHQGKADVFSSTDGLSSDFVERIFEDREGNIWVPTLEGLDRFRDLAVPTISVKQGISNATVESVLVAQDGSVWLGTVDGLNHWNDDGITVYRRRGGKAPATGPTEALGIGGPIRTNAPARMSGVREVTASGLPDNAIQSLYQDFRDQLWVATRRGVAFLENGQFTPVGDVPGTVRAIAGDRVGNIWVSQTDHLYHLRDGKVVDRIPWATLGRQDYARSAIFDASQGGLWLGFRGTLAYFDGARIRTSYAVADGFAQARVKDIRFDREGALWAATEGGLSRLKNGRVATLNGKNGLPCDDVHWSIEDDDHSLWLYMVCGLVHVARPELDGWLAAADKDPGRQVQPTVFGASDGVRVHSSTTGFSPTVAKSRDGKLWFLPWDGVSVVDPHQLPFNKLPPPMHIERVTADRKTFDPASDVKGQVHLPPLVRDLEIDYTALSLVAPEKMLFRYKLENWDRDWQDVGNRRQAFYNNLSPGNYRFRVKACNNSGVWNEAGTALDLFVAPAYYQTTWFRLSCGAAFLALLRVLYQLRLRQVAQQFNMRLEERVNERTRIARDLHDTLLQSFQGVLMKFEAVTYLIPARPAEALENLERVIEQARQAIIEGRDAVQGLRSSMADTNDLARAISRLGDELAADQNGKSCPEFRLNIKGTSRHLVPLVQDEVHRIASEAVRNAFRHAQAARIEVEIRYDQRQLGLLVRDNGKGIDPKIIGEGGCAGHYGMPGMHERATLVGGKLVVTSGPERGTEAELTIPASIAYSKSSVAGGVKSS